MFAFSTIGRIEDSTRSTRGNVIICRRVSLFFRQVQFEQLCNLHGRRLGKRSGISAPSDHNGAAQRRFAPVAPPRNPRNREGFLDKVSLGAGNEPGTLDPLVTHGPD